MTNQLKLFFLTMFNRRIIRIIFICFEIELLFDKPYVHKLDMFSVL